MSIKELFQNKQTNKIIKTQTLASASANAEGIDFIKQKTKEQD